MLTKLEHQLLSSCFYANSISQTFPFSWHNNGFKRLDTNQTIWQKIEFLFSISFCVVHLIYLIVRLIPGYGHTSEQFETLHFSVLMNGLMVLAFIVVLSLQLGALARSDELASLGNQLLYFNQGAGGGEYASSNLREKLFISLATYLFLLAGIFIPGLSFVFSENKYTINSALPDAWKSTTVLMLTVLIEACAWSKLVMVHFFVLYAGHAYITTNNFWMDKCSEWITSRHTHMQRRALSMYKTLTILNTIYNNGSGSALFPILKTGVEIGGIFCLFAIVRFQGSIEWFMYAFFVAAFIFCTVECSGAISYMATVNEKSMKFLDAIQQTSTCAQSSGYMDVIRNAKSCRPLVCRVSTFFFVEKATKLIYMSLLSTIFMNVLLGAAKL